MFLFDEVRPIYLYMKIPLNMANQSSRNLRYKIDSQGLQLRLAVFHLQAMYTSAYLDAFLIDQA